MVEDAVARGALKRVLPSLEATPLDPHLAYPSREQQHVRVRKFIEHLTEARSRLKSSGLVDVLRSFQLRHRAEQGERLG